MALAALFALSGCGDDADKDASDPSSESSSTDQASEGPTDDQATSENPTEGSNLPSCSDVWIGGEELPKAYRGCLHGTDAVDADLLRCGSGQSIVTYDDRFWAVRGSTINETDGLARDRGFRAAKRTCLA